MKTWILLLTVIMQAGCFPDYFQRFEVKDQLSDHDLIGRWMLTEQSLAMLEKEHFGLDGYQSTITLGSEEQCILSKFFCDDELVSLNARWLLAHDIPQGRGPAKKNELQITVTGSKRSGICRLNISRDHGHLVLWQHYGDPDGRRYVEYRQGRPAGSD